MALAIIAWQKPNVLLLDEPTNHLDLEMRHALTMALQNFAGAIIVVSHDRHLLKNTVEDFWLVADGRVEEFKGDLHDYEVWLNEYHKVISTSEKTSDSCNAPENSERETSEQRRERKRRKRRE